MKIQIVAGFLSCMGLIRPSLRSLGRCVGWLLLILPIVHVHADNAEFQDFFFDACSNNPGGDLGDRCAESNGGNLSGDSESSLNPSQTMSGNDSALSMARERSKESRERNRALREEEDGGGAGALDIGPFSLVVNGRFTNTEADRRENERGYESDAAALSLGADYRYSPQFVVGSIIGYERTDLEFDRENPGVNFNPPSSAGDYDSDSYSLTLFGSYSITERFYIDGSIGFAALDYEFRRNAVFQNSGRTTQSVARTRGDADGDTRWASINGGYHYNRAAWTYAPYAGLTHTQSSVDSYSEKDLSQSGLAMRFSQIERDSLLGHLGVMAHRAINREFGVLMPQLKIEYEHEFDRDPGTPVAFFLQDPDRNLYRFTGEKPDRNYFNVGLGLVAVLPNGWQPYIDYEQQFGNDDFDRYRISAGLRVEL